MHFSQHYLDLGRILYQLLLLRMVAGITWLSYSTYLCDSRYNIYLIELNSRRLIT